MTSVADLVASAAATEQRSRTLFGETITFDEPSHITPPCANLLPTAPLQIDTKPGFGSGASTLYTAPPTAPRQGPIPAEYSEASAAELDARIIAAKETL